MAFETGCSHAVKFEGHERWTRVSLLLGIDGLVVDRVLVEASGRRVVHCSTGPESAGWCPVCPAAIIVAEGSGGDPTVGYQDRTRPTRTLVAQTEVALPGAGMRAKGVDR